MRALTLGAARPTIARVLNVCSDSDQVPLYVNEAQERLLNRETYPVGALARYRICAASGCISWPRQIRTIEAFAVCETPGVIRGTWFEFIGWPNGNGILDEDSMPGTTLIDRETACCFDDVVATVAAPRKIAVIADNAADVGKRITLRYFDGDGNRVYTSIDGVVQEGERLTLVAPGGVFPANAVLTSKTVLSASLYQVVKETTKYPVYLYECTTVPVVTKLIAKYEPSEANPIYRRSQIPGFEDMTACGTGTGCDANKQITALVKLQHVPVVVDNDPLVIGNLAALKLMVMAILREEQNREGESQISEAKANREIDGELSSYLGTGQRDTLKVAADFGAGQSGCVGWWSW